MMKRRTALIQVGKVGMLGGLFGGLPISTPSLASSTQRKIKIGQIGVQHAHASKLSVYRRSADYEVVGIAESDVAARKKGETQEPFRDLPFMTQDELLNQPGLEAVLVETHVRDLLKTAERCLEAGKHIHLDKPAGSSFPHFQRILELAKSKGLLVQMGYMYRYHPAIQLMHRLIREGYLGEIFEVHSAIGKVLDDGTRRELAEFPGGIFFELACHVLDLVHGVLGKPSEVQGIMQHASKQRDNLSDNCLATLRYPNAIATIKSSAMEIEGGARRHFVVCGTQGTFHIQPLDQSKAILSLAKDGGEFKKGVQSVEFPKYTRYVDDAADMAKILRGEKSADFTYEHDLEVQRSLLTACGMSLS